MIDASTLLVNDFDYEAELARLTAENLALKHDLRKALARPVFRPTNAAAPATTKLVLRTKLGICMIGHTGSDVLQWAPLPISYETFKKEMKYRGEL